MLLVSFNRSFFSTCCTSVSYTHLDVYKRQEVFKPVMSTLGLPGEASLIIILGYFLGTYAGLGAIAAMELNTVQITTIAIMLSISHSLISETAIVKKLGASAAASITAVSYTHLFSNPQNPLL